MHQSDTKEPAPIKYAMELPFDCIEANIECVMNNDANSMHNWNMLLSRQIDFLLIFFLPLSKNVLILANSRLRISTPTKIILHVEVYKYWNYPSRCRSFSSACLNYQFIFRYAESHCPIRFSTSLPMYSIVWSSCNLNSIFFV